MDLTDLLTSIASSLAAAAAVAATLYPKIAAARKAIAPLLGRRRLRVVVVAPRERVQAAEAFATSLRTSGYAEVIVTSATAAAAGSVAVVVWHPEVAESAAIVAEIMGAAPTAAVLVITHPNLPLSRSERILLSNNEYRLRGDLALVAEVAR